MRPDPHAHSCRSGVSTIRGLGPFLRESYSTPSDVHRQAQARFWTSSRRWRRGVDTRTCATAADLFSERSPQ